MTKQKLLFFIQLLPLFLSSIIALIIITAFKFLPPKLPLFYSLSWGERQLAAYQQFLIIPISISAVALINLIVSWQLHESQSFFKNTLLAATILISVTLTIALIKIILLFI